MSAVIALVGRPNVGKSTLFNRLTRSRDALVADLPGLTRDRIYGLARLDSRPCMLVDTGGLDAEGESVQSLAREQTWRAIAEADAVVLMVDAVAGLCPQDEEIARQLRTNGRPVVCAVNKSEGRPAELVSAEFFRLGLGVPVAISANRGDGMGALVSALLEVLPEDTGESAPAEGPVIAVVGRPNAGKSTLVNAMLGDSRVIVSDQPGTTRDSVRVPLERDGRHYVLIDTAGVRRRTRIDDTIEKFSVVKSLQAIADANVVVLLLDAQREVGAQDANLAGLVLEAGRAMVLAVNKWDHLAPDRRDRIRAQLDLRLPFLSFLKPHFISARHGTGVGDLFGAVDRAYRSAIVDLPTPRLTRLLHDAVASTPPPLVHHRPIKLKYAHQIGKNPPTVLVHGNMARHVPAGYQRYLANVFRRAFDLEGTTIRVQFRQSANPYAGPAARRQKRS